MVVQRELDSRTDALMEEEDYYNKLPGGERDTDYDSD